MNLPVDNFKYFQLIYSLQGERRLDRWIQVFETISQRLSAHHRLCHCNEIKISFDGSTRNKTFYLPKYFYSRARCLALRFFAVTIYNAMAFLGTENFHFSSGDAEFTEDTLKFFKSEYSGIGRKLPITQAVRAWNDIPAIQYSAEPLPSKSTVLVLNLGQTNLTSALVISTSEESNFLGKPRVLSKLNTSYGPPSNSTTSVKNLFTMIWREACNIIDGVGMCHQDVDAVVLAVASMARNNRIVPVPNGISKNLSKDALVSFSNMHEWLKNKLPAVPIGIVNDSELWGLAATQMSFRDAFSKAKTIAIGKQRALILRLGTSLCATLAPSTAMSEIGWVVGDMGVEAILFEQNGVKGTLRTILSFPGVQNLIRSLGHNLHLFQLVNWLDGDFDQSKKQIAEMVFREVGRWISTTIIVLKQYSEIDIVFLAGSLLSGKAGKIVSKSAMKYVQKNGAQIPSGFRIELLSDDNRLMKWGSILAAPLHLRSQEKEWLAA